MTAHPGRRHRGSSPPDRSPATRWPQEIARLTGSDRLFFYDSISPIVDADTVDTSIAFWASRYGKSTDGTDDYLNCPFDREQYERFVDELLKRRVRLVAHRRRRHAVLRGLPADRRDRAPRPRHAALRTDEADGADDPRTGRRP